MQATLRPSVKVAIATLTRPAPSRRAAQPNTRKPAIKRFFDLLMIALSAQAA